MNTLLLAFQVLGLIAIAALIWLTVRAFKKHFLWGIAVSLLSPFSALFFGVKYWKDEKKPFLAYITSFGAVAGIALYVFTQWGGWDVVRMALRVHQGVQSEQLSQQDASDFMNANLKFIENANPDEQDRRKIEMMWEFLGRNEFGMSNAEREKMHADVATLTEDQDLATAQHVEPESMHEPPPEQEDNTPQETAAATAAPPENARRIQSRRPSNKQAGYRVEYREIEVSDAGNYVGKSFKITRRNSAEREGRLIGSSPGRLLFEQRGRGGTFTFEYSHRDIEKLKLLARTDFVAR